MAKRAERRLEQLRTRLTRLRDEAIEQLRRLGISPETDGAAPRDGRLRVAA